VACLSVGHRVSMAFAGAQAQELAVDRPAESFHEGSQVPVALSRHGRPDQAVAALAPG